MLEPAPLDCLVPAAQSRTDDDPFTIPGDFFHGFADAYWEKKPRLFARPFSVPLADSEDVFRCLLRARSRILRRNGSPPSLRIFLDAGQLQSDTQAYHPLVEDRTLLGYTRRLAELAEGHRFGLTANTFHAGDAAIVRRLRRLLRALYEEVGLSVDMAESVCFIGNYRMSPFGIHRDRASNLTYVVSGRKRYRLFPGEVLASHPDVHLTSQYDRFLDQAITFEAGPGDVVYWPSDYWHVAENDALEPATTIGLAVFVSPQPFELLSTALTRVLSARETGRRALTFPLPKRPDGMEGSGALPADIAALWGAKNGEPAGDLAQALELESRRLWLELTSCLGLDESLPLREREPLLPTDLIRADLELPILFSNVGSKLLCAARGSSLVIPDRQFIRRGLVFLNRGEAVTIERVLQEAGNPDMQRVLERLYTIHAFERD